jgi:predicted nucleotidyltransferase
MSRLEASMTVVTVSQRHSREAARRLKAGLGVIARLRAFAVDTGHCGRFIIFGSVAAGAVRHSSDFDVLTDFPEDLESRA